MTSILLRGALAACLSAAAFPAVAQTSTAAPATAPATAGGQTPAFETGAIPAPHLTMPTGDPTAMVVLLSDAAGWGASEEATAESLGGEGAFVIGIDLRAYLAALEDVAGPCAYTLSDIERLSQQMQRASGSKVYRLPIVAGIGAGGAMALAIAAQTPPATVESTIAVDPIAGIALAKPLCTPATRTASGTFTTYGLTKGPLPAPILAPFTDAADAAGRAHVETDLKAAHPDIDVEDSGDDSMTTLGAALSAAVSAPPSDDLDLPIDVLETTATSDTMAVIYSGDGGWRDLDKSIGEAFQKSGVPTIGVDSLRYFWSQRTPEETADDLRRMIDLYSKRWGVKNVLLVGYSFGADILPTTYPLLPAAEKAMVKDISLLALSDYADFEISISGWLGAASDGPARNTAALEAIDPKLVQCIYGTEDTDSVCPSLPETGMERIAIEGGHHFDGDYDGLAARILAGMAARVAAGQAAGAGSTPQ